MIVIFILFIFFIEKNILVDEILNIKTETIAINKIIETQNTISLFLGLCIFIISYLFIKYRTNLKDLFKFIFYSLMIFIVYFYKKSTDFYATISLFLNNQVFILFVFLFIFSVVFPMILNYIDEKNLLENNSKKQKLYSSRENKIETLKGFLSVYDEFSITGEWGIGKSFFLKYFFKNSNKNKYEEIIIDVSSYSTNDGILKKIDSEINNILKKHHIFRFSPSIFKDINVKSSFIETIKNLISYFLNDNLNSCVESLPNTIVLSLDNIERINNLNRITTLFSAIDEQLIHKIANRKKFKVIYIYDKNYMEKIFGKERIDFNLYISKYSESSIQLYGVEENDFKEEIGYNEIISIKNTLLKEIEIKIDNFNKQWNQLIMTLVDNKYGFDYDSPVNKSTQKVEYSKWIKSEYSSLRNTLLEEIKNNINLIDKKLKNPRFIYQCLKLIKNDRVKLPIEYITKYKIILDIFQNVNLTKESIGEVNIIELIKNSQQMNHIYLSTENKELIAIIFILFNNSSELFRNFLDDLRKKGLI